MRRTIDLLTIRALQYGLDPEASLCLAARDLSRRAHGDRRLLQRVLTRIDHGLRDSWSPVGQRAREVVVEALRITAPDGQGRLPYAS
jgi:hypothetical protein